MTVLTALVDLARAAATAPDSDALKARLLHNLAAAVGEQDETRPIRNGLVEDQGPGSRALELAAMMHARTQDDFHPAGRVHVGAVVVPAVLALGAPDPLPAIAAGYEVLTAVAAAYSKIAQQRGYRPTGMFGPIGAAAAAGVALGLDDDEMAAALALASAMSAGTNQSWIDGSDEWLVEVALASRAGVDAARLARAGVRGAEHAFDGPAGWCGAFFGDEGATRLDRALETGAARTADVAIKLYPVSGIAQVPTHLAGEIGATTGRAQPEQIEVRMTPRELDYPGSRNRGPFHSRSDSLMSVARCVALSYLHGSVPYRALAQAPDTREARILHVIELVPDRDLDETEAEVRVRAAGQTVTRRGHGSELLYPDWSQTSRSVTDIARRSEAPVDVVRSCHESLEADLDAATLTKLMGAER